MSYSIVARSFCRRELPSFEAVIVAPVRHGRQLYDKIVSAPHNRSIRNLRDQVAHMDSNLCRCMTELARGAQASNLASHFEILIRVIAKPVKPPTINPSIRPMPVLV